MAGATGVTVDGQAATLVGDDFTAGPYTLAEGARSWTIVARDAAGNTAQVTHRIVRDSQPPTVSIAQPAAGAVLGTTTVDVTGSAADPRLATVTVNGIAAPVTGSSWIARQVPLGEGTTTLTARAEDRAGNAAEASRQVVRDTQAPTLAITDPAPGTVVPGATIAIRGTASDAHLDRVEVNGTRATLAGESWSLTVPLQEGANEVSVRAVDRVGTSSQASVSVTRDSQAPAVRIEQPADAARLNVQSIAVSGTVEQEEGIAVTVNGAAATITGGTFAASGVALVEGENRLVARVTDRLGNQGAHTRFVYRDTVAPRLLSADPASGALAVPPGSAFRLVFSEDLADPAAGSWRLETAGGQTIAANGALDGAALTVTPAAPLPSTTEIRLVLTAGLKDPAGNALAEPPTLTFTTADSAAPGAPAISPQPPALLCAAAVTLSGTAEGLRRGARRRRRRRRRGAGQRGRAVLDGRAARAGAQPPVGHGARRHRQPLARRGRRGDP